MTTEPRYPQPPIYDPRAVERVQDALLDEMFMARIEEDRDAALDVITYVALAGVFFFSTLVAYVLSAMGVL